MTYDVATLTREGERRLAKVASICERFGVRVQYSVFECRVSPASYQVLVGELSDVLEPSEDSINVYQLDRSFASVRTSLGKSGIGAGSRWIFDSNPRTSGDS